MASVQFKVDHSEDLTEAPKIQKRAVAKPLEYYEQHGNESYEAMAKAFFSVAYSMSEINKYFGIHY